MVRRPRMMPPMPSVSAMVWRRPYFLGISKSIDRAGLVAADLDHADGVVGAVEGRAAVGGGLDGAGGAPSCSALPVRHDLGGLAGARRRCRTG